LPDFKGAGGGLEVGEAGFEGAVELRDEDAGAAGEFGGEKAAEEVVETGAVPPAVDVGVAETEGALAADELEHGGIVDVDVVGLGAVDGHTGGGDEGLKPLFGVLHGLS
jgi:hypothetical protein